MTRAAVTSAGPGKWLARTVDDLTPTWATGVLRHAGLIDTTINVSQVATEAIGAGQLADVVRAQLTFDGCPAPAAPASLIVKHKELLPISAEFLLADEAGGTTKASSQISAGGFITPFGPGFVWCETGHQFEIDGQPGVGMYEQGWQAFDLDHLRGGAYVEQP